MNIQNHITNIIQVQNFPFFHFLYIKKGVKSYIQNFSLLFL